MTTGDSGGGPLARLTLPLLALLAVGVSLRPGLENDAWWHLASGRWMLQEGTWLREDVFSWTRAGADWPRPGLVADLAMSLLHAAGGVPLLVAAAAACFLAAVLLVLAWSPAPPLPTLLVGVLTIFAMIPAATPRPLVTSLPLTALTVVILRREQRQGDGTRLIWALPVVAVVWVNLHGAFVVLFALVGAHGLGLLLDRARGRDLADPAIWRRLGRLTGAGVLAVAGVVVNPFGWRMLTYPIETVGLSVLAEAVDEWARPVPTELRAWPLYLLITVSVVVLWRRRREVAGADLVSIVLFGVLALTAIRHAPIFALVAAPVLLGAMQDQGRGSLRAAWAAAPGRERAIEAGLLTCVAGLVLSVTAPALTPAGNQRAIDAFHGERAVRAVAEGAVVDRLWNSYDLGGQVIWLGYPEVLVSIDSRTDLYGDQAVREHLAEWRGERDAPSRFASDGIGTVLVERRAPLVAQLEAAGWLRRAEDHRAVVLQAPPTPSGG